MYSNVTLALNEKDENMLDAYLDMQRWVKLDEVLSGQKRKLI